MDIYNVYLSKDDFDLCMPSATFYLERNTRLHKGMRFTTSPNQEDYIKLELYTGVTASQILGKIFNIEDELYNMVNNSTTISLVRYE